MTTVYLLSGDWPGLNEDEVRVLPPYSMSAIAGGEHLALGGRENFAIQPRSIPSPDQGTSEIRAFFNHGYSSVESTVENQVPRVAVSAPNLGVVYGAVLDADFRPRAFYECREDNDGLYRWAEVDSDQFRGADSIEAFQQIVGAQDAAATRGESPEQLNQRDERLLGNTLGRNAMLGVIDANDDARKQAAREAEYAASAAEAVEQSAPAATPPAPEPEPVPPARLLDADQAYFTSSLPAQSRYTRWGFGSASAVFAAGDRVAVDATPGRETSHDVDGRWQMTTMSSVRNAFTSAHGWGSRNREQEQQFIMVRGDRGMALRRGDSPGGGTFLQLFQPTGDRDATGAAIWDWTDFPTDQNFGGSRLGNWRQHLMQTSLGKPEGLEQWARDARAFLAGGLNEDGTRAAHNGQEALAGLSELPDEVQQQAFAAAIGSAEAVAVMRAHEPTMAQTPSPGERWLAQVRQQAEATRVAQRQKVQGQQWQTPGWYVTGGPDM